MIDFPIHSSCKIAKFKTLYGISKCSTTIIIKVPADKSNIDILCYKSMNRKHE